MWPEELVRQQRAELERQAAEARLARQVPRGGSRRVRVRVWMAAALHRVANSLERASRSVRHRETC